MAKAVPTCAEPGCDCDAIMIDGGKPRWCPEHYPRPEPRPCDAVTKRDENTKEPLETCGTTEQTIWSRSPDGTEIVRCPPHRTSEWLPKNRLI